MRTILFALLMVLLALPLACSDDVTISLLDRLLPEEIEVSSPHSFILLNEPLEHGAQESIGPKIIVHPGEKIIVKFDESRLICTFVGEDAQPKDYSALSVSMQGENLEIRVVSKHKYSRRVTGFLKLAPGHNRIQCVLQAPLEQVVAEILAAEFPLHTDNHEAVKAMSVCIRSYILWLQDNNPQLILKDTSSHMVYRGLDGAFNSSDENLLPAIAELTSETKGLVLVHAGKIVPGYFHACCGGRTTTPSQIWGFSSLDAALPGVICKYCGQSPHYHWTTKLQTNELDSFVKTHEPDGELDIELEHYPDTQYVKTVQLSCGNHSAVFSGESFRIKFGRVFGWNRIKSNRFDIQRIGETLLISGTGFGHGIGLCQAGADTIAREGSSFQEILKFYFPSCVISPANEN